MLERVKWAVRNSPITTGVVFLTVWAVTFTLAVWVMSGPPPK